MDTECVYTGTHVTNCRQRLYNADLWDEPLTHDDRCSLPREGEQTPRTRPRSWLCHYLFFSALTPRLRRRSTRVETTIRKKEKHLVQTRSAQGCQPTGAAPGSLACRGRVAYRALNIRSVESNCIFVRCRDEPGTAMLDSWIAGSLDQPHKASQWWSSPKLILASSMPW